MLLEERLNRFLKKSPIIHHSSFISKNACIIGDVLLGEDTSVWPFVVIRADINSIKIDFGSNIQDGTVIHLADDFGVSIGKYVTIGHSAVIHACTIEDDCLIGMRSTIMDGAIVGHHSIIGAHTLVTQNMVIPPGSLVMGTPAKIIRTLSSDEQNNIRSWAQKYIDVSRYYLKNNIHI